MTRADARRVTRDGYLRFMLVIGAAVTVGYFGGGAIHRQFNDPPESETTPNRESAHALRDGYVEASELRRFCEEVFPARVSHVDGHGQVICMLAEPEGEDGVQTCNCWEDVTPPDPTSL